jgi:methionyl-tRNA synthetase
MWFFNMVLFAVLCGSFRQRIVQAFVQKNVFFASLAARAKSSGLGAVDVGTPATAFDDGKRPFQITTPIYYVNDKPHIGHAYTSTACDVIARFMRLSGRDVFFLSGTDEHGEKVEQSAEKQNMDPQGFVDQVSVNFRELLELMNISNDKFIRTTSEDHKKSVQHFWNVMVEKGYIYMGTYSGWYSVRDECFYTESELIDGKAPTGAEVSWVAKEESYFFKLSQFEEKLLDLYERNPHFIAPESRKNEVVSFVKGGLRDLSISRTSFKWGVPVPDDEDHVMYVWVDALTNYISALGYPDMGEGSDFSKFWPASIHIVGKDILRFHAVYWPAMLMAAELPLPKRLFAHGWWTKDGQKISKSIGNVIDPVELVNKVRSFGFQ